MKFLLYFLTWMLAWNVWQSLRARTEVVAMLGGLRLRHVGWGAVMLSTTLACVVGLSLYADNSANWLNWSLFSSVSQGGGGLIATAMSGSGGLPPWFPAVFGIVLLLALPMAALVEEQIFRRGAERRHWLLNGLVAGAFGLAHLTMGVPVFAALAQISAGMWLNFHYRRAFLAVADRELAVAESGRVHLVSNLLVSAIILGALLIGAIR